jgi:hypothetical protein
MHLVISRNTLGIPIQSDSRLEIFVYVDLLFSREETRFIGFGYCGRGVGDVEFFVDVADVVVDGVGADPKLVSDLFFHQTVCHQGKDFGFPIRQQTAPVRIWRPFVHGFKDVFGHVGVNRCATLHDEPDSGDNLIAGGGFQQVSSGSG